MKKILTIYPFIFLFVIVSDFIYSQNTSIKDSLKHTDVDDFIVSLDKSKIVNDILYERVYSIANLETFNLSEPDTSSSKHFKQTFSELNRACSNKDLLDFEELKKTIKEKKKFRDKLDIGIIDIDFSMLNYTESGKNNGLIFKDQQLIPIEGKEPFKIKKALVISPLLGAVKGGLISINFASSLMFEYSDNSISDLYIEYNNISHLVFKNSKFIKSTVSYDFGGTGEKTLKFIVIFKDGSKKVTYSTLYYINEIDNLGDNNDKGIPSSGLVENGSFTANIPFQGYEESQQYFGHIKYRIYYRTNDGYYPPLNKPFIIIDGFDPMDLRKIEDYDCLSDPDCVDFYEDNISEDHESIVDGMFLVDEPSVSVLDELRSMGYDVIVVNQPTHAIPENNNVEIDGGADYIERNALAHVGFYQYINNRLIQNGSDEELVIAGPSMGGQISRYALAYMEKNSIPHNTRLWISIDSPHRGANIPLTVQSNIGFLAYMVGSNDAEIMYEKMVKSVAARQQLIDQYDSTFFPYHSNSLFNTYYTNTNNNGLTGSNGFPMNLRKIALVNGSMTSKKNGYDHQLVLDLGADDSTIFGKIKITRHHEHFMPSNNGTQEEIYHGFQRFSLFSSTEFWSYKSNNDIRGCIDASPGGRFYSQKLLKESILEGLQDEGYTGWVHSFQGYHSFIPTVSSLAFYDTNFDWSGDINRNLICDNEIPFDSYYAPDENQKHTTFYDESFEWVIQELEGNHMYPSSHYDTDLGIEIGGLDEISPITGYQTNYGVNKYNTDIQWSVFPSDCVNIVSGQGTRLITLEVVNAQDSFILMASFYDECMNEYVSVIKEVVFGAYENLNISGSDIVYPYNGYCTYTYIIHDLSGTGIPVTWEYPTNRMFIVSNVGEPNQINLGAFTVGSDEIISASFEYNGQLFELEKEISLINGNCWNPGGKNSDINNHLTVFPNPIDHFQKCNVLAEFENYQDEEVYLTVYDQYSVKINSFVIQNYMPFEIDFSNIKSGLYIFKANCGNDEVYSKIIIE